MSYLAQSQLQNDVDFQRRVYSVNVEQAEVYVNDARPAYVATAQAVMKDEGGLNTTFVRLDAAGPGIADKATTADGIDQSLVTDADLLSLTQANWQVVAALYFTEDGTPIEGGTT